MHYSDIHVLPMMGGPKCRMTNLRRAMSRNDDHVTYIFLDFFLFINIPQQKVGKKGLNVNYAATFSILDGTI